MVYLPEPKKQWRVNIMAKANEIKYLTAIKTEKPRKKFCRFKKYGMRYIDYKDGDFNSSIYYADADKEQDKNRMYEWGTTTLINDRARVYKGGNWRDRAYYTIPGTRRFLDERRAMSTLGFRCAMDRLGSPTGISGQE